MILKEFMNLKRGTSQDEQSLKVVASHMRRIKRALEGGDVESAMAEVDRAMETLVHSQTRQR